MWSALVFFLVISCVLSAILVHFETTLLILQTCFQNHVPVAWIWLPTLSKNWRYRNMMKWLARLDSSSLPLEPEIKPHLNTWTKSEKGLIFLRRLYILIQSSMGGCRWHKQQMSRKKSNNQVDWYIKHQLWKGICQEKLKFKQWICSLGIIWSPHPKRLSLKYYYSSAFFMFLDIYNF